MSEAPLLNDEAARTPTGEILDQSSTQALETRRAEVEAARVAAEAKTTDTTKPSTTQSSESTSTTKSDADTKTTDQAKPTDEKKPTDAPKVEPYADFKAPEGYTIDKALIDQVTPIFREANLSQEAAQKLVDLHIANAVAAAKAPTETYETMRKDWRAQVSADAEIAKYTRDGKTGIEAVQIDMARALNSLGDPKLADDFRTAMNITGAGDNPAFVRTFWKLAQGVAEGKPVAGKSPSPLGMVDPSKPVAPSAAQALYPNLPSAARPN